MTRLTSKLLSMAAVAALGITSAAFADGPRVLVIPFTALNVPDDQQWISKGVQEDLIADFGHSGTYAPIAFQGQAMVEDNVTAARLARTASAPLAVRGAAQVVNGNIRLTAQLIDAKSGDTVSTASVTGPVNDLLRLEDQLSAQLRGMPAAPAAPAPTVAAAAQGPAPIVIQQPAPQPQVIVISQAAQPDYSNYYGYGNGYPYNYGYGYGYYPGFFPGVIVVSNGHHDHDHDHDHGHFPGPPPFPGHGSGPSNPIVTGPSSGISLPIPTGITFPIPQAPLPIPRSAPVAPRMMPHSTVLTSHMMSA